MPYAFSKNSGLSLIEILLVLALSALIISLVLPRFTQIKIRAARAEMHYTLKGIHTAAHSYRAEHGVYPDSFHVGTYQDKQSIKNCGAPNPVGYSVSQCNKLRYYYLYSGTGAFGNGIDLSRKTYFTVNAIANYQDDIENPDLKSYSGIGPPTNLCHPKAGFNFSYGKTVFYDHWTIFESGHFQPYLNEDSSDAMLNCFN